MALKNYSTLRQIDGHGNTALHHAAENGFMEAIKLLIKYKCGLNSTNNMGFTPLIVALQNYHTEVAKELLNAGASAYILSPKFDSALGLAIKLVCKRFSAYLSFNCKINDKFVKCIIE